MEFIDLKTQYQHIQDKVRKRIEAVLEHGRFIMGPEVAELETTLANYVGVSHAIACANGTDALQMALMALGLKPGDEVIMPAFSYFATVEVCLLLRLTPVFVDIDVHTYLIDPSKISACVTPRTKAIMPVSLFGQCVDFDAINAIAGKHNLAVIEDGAQSFGARINDKKSLSATTIGCTSFFPAKPLGCYGDGGMCFTNDETLAKALRSIRSHGQSGGQHRHDRVGINSRLDTMQAAILLEKIAIFDQELAARAKVASYYDEHLREYVAIPVIAPGNISVYSQYTIGSHHRDGLKEALANRGIPTQIYYPMLMPAQAACRSIVPPNQTFPQSEQACQHVLSLPMHPYLTQGEQDTIIDVVRQYAGGKA